MKSGFTVGALLSLTGRYARFGRQAAAGLEAWRSLAGAGVRLVVEDDGGDPARVTAGIAGLAARCDVLLGPYSTQLTRVAVSGLGDRLLWNHGGAGDDVQRLAPGRVVSVLTPAGRYAEPFLRRVARPPLRIVAGAGSFGRQVAAGAEALARELGMEVVGEESEAATLLSAGVFEDDVATVRRALALPRPPRTVWSVAAGVRDFGGPDGVYGPAQWVAGSGAAAAVGPSEAAFLAAMGGPAPDYPAVQAAAAAALAARCAELAGSTAPAAQWAAAAALDTTTLFGRFRIDPATGVQVGHETVLVRWSAGAARRA